MTDQTDEKLRQIAEIIEPEEMLWRTAQDWDRSRRPDVSIPARLVRSPEEVADAFAPQREAALTKARAILSLLLADKAALQAERDEARKDVDAAHAIGRQLIEAAEARATASDAERDGLRAALERAAQALERASVCQEHPPHAHELLDERDAARTALDAKVQP